MNECIECGAKMQLQKIQYRNIMVDAYVCTRCNEIVLPSKSAKIIEMSEDKYCGEGCIPQN